MCRILVGFDGLPEHVVVVDRMVMPDIAEFDVGGAQEFENDAIGSIDAKAPDFMMLGVKLFAVE